VYAFVPDIPLTCGWTDERLYKRYGLSRDEIAFIESTVNPMPAGESEIGKETDVEVGHE
jgi:site-specific DNA-methyltransferase (adenine-specific)